jgi:hypothetical protein
VGSFGYDFLLVFEDFVLKTCFIELLHGLGFCFVFLVTVTD